MSMILSQTRVKGRVLALLILAALIAAMLLIVVRPVATILASPRQEAFRQARLLAVYQSQAALLPELNKRLAAAREREASLPGLIVAANAALAEASIQGEVKDLIDAAGGELRSSANLKPAQIAHFEKIALRLDLAVPMDRLEDLLYRFETAQPYLFVGDISIGAPESGGNAAEPNPQLQIQMTVEAYRWTGAK